MDRKAYIDKLTQQLNEWDDEIIKLEAKVKEVSSSAKTEYEKQISDVKEKRQTVSEKLGELKETGSEAWEELSDGLELAVQDIKKAWQKAWQKFTSDIENPKAHITQATQPDDSNIKESTEK